MQQSSTAYLIFALVIVVSRTKATEHFYNYEEKTDQLAQEAKHRAVTIIEGPKYVASSTPAPAVPANNTPPEKRPPNNPPPPPYPNKPTKQKYVEQQRLYIGPIQNRPHPINPYGKPPPPNSVYKYHKVIPLQKSPHRNTIYPKQQHLVFAASTSKPTAVAKSPKFSLPVETINGIRSDFVRPPHFGNFTTSSTTTTPTTTTKYLRTKRIWPKHILDKLKTSNTTTGIQNTENKTNTENDLNSEGSHHKIIIITDKETASTARPTRGSYRPVTRTSKRKPTTPAPDDFTHVQPNDWVPIIPSHYTVKKVRQSKQTHISKRSDRSEVYLYDPKESPNQHSKRLMYLQSFGLIPVAHSQITTEPSAAATAARKNLIYVGKTKQLKPHVYSGYRGKPVVHTTHINGDYQTDESNPPKIMTKIKHHHHHHHHRYIKTVEKPVRVEVPKPVPVPVPMPVPVKVEHKVPVPVPVKVPHPVPVKVIEKEYVPKPYPVVQYQQVPVIKHVEVKVPQPYPVHVEKKVPYPVKVEVPVPKPYPVAVPYEKKVPVPYPVRVMVPQPYPVETKVPVPVKEQVEVVKHVAVRVPVPRPYPVRVPVPVEIEKKVPFPVEVEKKVPMPYRVLVPEKVEVEKKVPVYIPRPYPVEKKVPVPVKIPYPVRIPVRVPFPVPIFMNYSQTPATSEHVVSSNLQVGEDNQIHTHYSYGVHGNTVTSSPQQSVTDLGNFVTNVPHHTVTFNGNTVTNGPHQTVTFHGNIGPHGFKSRADVVEDATTPYSASNSIETENHGFQSRSDIVEETATHLTTSSTSFKTETTSEKLENLTTLKPDTEISSSETKNTTQTIEPR